MLTNLLRILGQREEYATAISETIERRVRRVGNAYICYDINWEKKDVLFYFYALASEAAHFCTNISSVFEHSKLSEKTKWQRQNNRKIKKRLFYNRVQPKVWKPDLRGIDGESIKIRSVRRIKKLARPKKAAIRLVLK